MAIDSDGVADDRHTHTHITQHEEFEATSNISNPSIRFSDLISCRDSLSDDIDNGYKTYKPAR